MRECTARSGVAREEAYLSQAVDLHDLEWRMRELERLPARPYWLEPRL